MEHIRFHLCRYPGTGIVEGILHIAKLLGTKVVVEGIETIKQAKLLDYLRKVNEEISLKTGRLSEPNSPASLRQAEGGVLVPERSRERGLSAAPFYT